VTNALLQGKRVLTATTEVTELFLVKPSDFSKIMMRYPAWSNYF